MFAMNVCSVHGRAEKQAAQRSDAFTNSIAKASFSSMSTFQANAVVFYTAFLSSEIYGILGM